MMNKLFIFGEYGRTMNYGIGTYIQNIITSFVNSFSITVVTLNTPDKEPSFFSEKGIRYISIPNLYFSRIKEKDFSEKEERKRYCLYVVSILSHHIFKSDKIIFHLNHTHDYFLALLLKQNWSQSNIVLTIHYFTWTFALQGNISYLAKIMTKKEIDLTSFEKGIIYSGLFEQKLFNIVDHIIYLSQSSGYLLENYYEISKTKINLIPNGLSDRAVKTNKNRLRQYYNISSDEKMILFVGRIENAKGVNLLIEAFKLVLKEISNVHLYLVGEGNLNDYILLCNPIWKKITFCGKLDQEQIDHFYQMSDIGILPSLFEQCSYVLIEMMMFGLPIIGTTAIGIDEMLKEGVNGRKVQIVEEESSISFSLHELKQTILDMLLKESLTIYSMENRREYLKKYTNNCMKFHLEKVYENKNIYEIDFPEKS